MASFSKFNRPETPSPGVITDRDLGIVETILRYRFAPTSELVRLVGGNEDVTYRRLRKLWERRLINRFAFPFPRPHSEFIYYLDGRQTLELLVQGHRLTEIHPQMEEEVRLNREADYAGAALRGEFNKLGFMEHNLMISRLHFMLEMASREVRPRFELGPWRQGGELQGYKLDVPEIKSRRINGSNHYVWEERDETVRLPVEPDALFSLRLPSRLPEEQLAHFCYEADRGTMPMADMLKKLRAYYHLIKRRQKHQEAFGVHPIRAVLIETTDERRARKLMELALSPSVIGESKRSGLFWFVISPIFESPGSSGHGKQAAYLSRPQLILDRLWALPDLTMRSLWDAENSGRA